MNRYNCKWNFTIFIVLFVLIKAIHTVSSPDSRSIKRSEVSTFTGGSSFTRQIRAADVVTLGKSIIQESKTTEASKVTASKQEPKSDLKTKPEEEKSKDPEVTESSKNASLSEDSKKKEEEKSITAKKEDVKETPKQPPKETAKKVDGKKTDKSVEAENSDFDDELTPKIVKSGSNSSRTLFIFILLIIGCYFCYHNKNKVLGMIVEGRPAGGHGRRSGTVRYRPLETEDAAMESGIY